MNDIWHHGKIDGNKILVQKASKKTQVWTKIPETVEEITDINSALAYILGGKTNLQRVSGYECYSHKKIHKYTFHSCISFTFPRMYGKDTEEEVIEFAKDLLNR